MFWYNKSIAFFVIALIHPDSIQYIHIADDNRDREKIAQPYSYLSKEMIFLCKENLKIDFNFFLPILIIIRNDS